MVNKPREDLVKQNISISERSRRIDVSRCHDSTEYVYYCQSDKTSIKFETTCLFRFSYIKNVIFKDNLQFKAPEKFGGEHI